ncbi:MAG: RIP metalloprotease RseP [Candidatus Margulisbacteria bacterium]|nr:RIP metalloprotease RseP [Candidatus Margulisiibacteriota bacterium]
MLITIVAFVLVFLAITLVHEGGHLLFAKRCGIRVHEFGIGYGPTLFKFTFHNTLYKVNLIPILGYVAIAGLETEDPREKETPESEKYYNKSPFAKFISILAGPLMNLFLGFLVFAVIFMFSGVPAGISNEIATITPGSPAAKAGLMPGDLLLSINRQTFKDPLSAIKIIHQSAGKTLTLAVARDGKTLTFKAAPLLNKKMKVGLLGFSLKPISKMVSPLSAIYIAFKETLGLTLTIIILFGKLLLGKFALSDLAGPIGIAQITGQSAQMGFASFMQFLAFFSINVAVFNLLPIPALDGGRLVFILIEAIRKKPINIELENKIHYFSFLAFLGLIAVVTVNDLVRIFR